MKRFVTPSTMAFLTLGALACREVETSEIRCEELAVVPPDHVCAGGPRGGAPTLDPTTPPAPPATEEAEGRDALDAAGWLDVRRWWTLPDHEGGRPCEVYEGELPPAPSAPLSFAGCGPGCAVAELRLGKVESLTKPVLSTRPDGSVVLRGNALGVEPGLDRPNLASVSLDLSRNRLLGVSLVAGDEGWRCSADANPDDAAFVYFLADELRSSDQPERYRYGSVDDRGWTWRGTWAPALQMGVRCGKAFTDGGRTQELFVICGSGLRRFEPGSSTLHHEVARVPGSWLVGSGHGGRTVAVEGTEDHRFVLHTAVRRGEQLSFRPLHETPLPGSPCKLSVYGDRAAFVGGISRERSGSCDTLLEQPTLHVVDLESGRIRSHRLSEGLHAAFASHRLGDGWFATFVGYGASSAEELVLVRLSDGRMRRVPPLGEGRSWRHAFAFDGDALWVLDARDAGSDGRLARRVVRFSLDRFDELGQPYDPSGG